MLKDVNPVTSFLNIVVWANLTTFFLQCIQFTEFGNKMFIIMNTVQRLSLRKMGTLETWNINKYMGLQCVPQNWKKLAPSPFFNLLVHTQLLQPSCPAWFEGQEQGQDGSGGRFNHIICLIMRWINHLQLTVSNGEKATATQDSEIIIK